jgi:hypothetical protein
MSEAGKKIATAAASLAVTLALFAVAEIAVRALGIHAPEWPIPVKGIATTH